MSTLFNYGTSGKTGGWSDKTKYFEEKEINGEDFKSTVRPSENPRVAVPSPFARFKIVQTAFETVSDLGEKADDRDKMLVSQVLDVLELLFENGLQKNVGYRLTIRPIWLSDITDRLMGNNQFDKNNGIYLFGRTLADYSAREKFGFAENRGLFAICMLNKPLAVTSPTSIFLPTPNYKDPFLSNIMINGFRPIFSERRDLISRNEEFVLYVYAWYRSLIKNNGGEPEALKGFGTYLTTQQESAHPDLKYKILNSASLSQYVPITTPQEKIKVEIWSTPLYSISDSKEGSLIEEKSDLILKSKVGDRHPLILTTNNMYTDMVYTSGQTMWDKKNPGFDYSDPSWRSIPVSERKLPNGQSYPHGFIYEHDFLADTLIQLPYRLNSEKFFDGNVQGLAGNETGFLPPVKEEYFNYFTADDLRENLSMKVTYDGPDTVEKVEVLLKLPTTKGREIIFKKTYYMAETLKTAIEDVYSSATQATGLIGYCGVAVNALPFIRAFADNNYYAFQLLVESRGLDGYKVNLNACSYDIRDGEGGHELTKTFSRYVRRTELGIPVITSYSLDGDNFDYLKLTFVDKENNGEAAALLIPREDIKMYKPESGNKLEFCFDFGTSNTFVAVKDSKGVYPDFKLPTDSGWMVSTIPDSLASSGDSTIMSFIAYGKQEFLPKITDRLPFPIPTVLATPKSQDDEAVYASEKNESDSKGNPFLTASIPFLYGSEDYGSKTNRIISDLKWAYRKKGNKDQHATPSFINELLFLAQVYAMSKNADLKLCNIYWTYPLSMDKKMISSLQTLWEAGYNRFFVGNTEGEGVENTAKMVNSFPESMAPMLYYTSDDKYGISSRDTTISVDIGGGTCDLVIIPGTLSKIKLDSFGFGAECIFGIDAAAESIPMFRNAINGISKVIKGKAVKSNPNYRAYELRAEELLGMKEEGRKASEMATHLFNLPNNPLFKGMNNQVDFNKWIQDHPHYHTVFLYYYAALVYYIAELWKTFRNADKPSRILFSGSGSKMFNILCEGNMSILGDYTTELFNIFAKDELDDEDLEEDIRVRMEVKEAKQITAKGVLTSTQKMAELKRKMQGWRSASTDGKEYILNFDMYSKGDSQLTYGDLVSDELIDALYEKITAFHTGLMEFMNDHNDDFDEDAVDDMRSMFTERFRSTKKWCRAIEGALGDVLDDTTESPDSEYPDVPFFEVIKSFIKGAMIPQD